MELDSHIQEKAQMKLKLDAHKVAIDHHNTELTKHVASKDKIESELEIHKYDLLNHKTLLRSV